MSALTSALRVLETLVQVITPKMAIQLLGARVLLPIVKYMCMQGANNDVIIRKKKQRLQQHQRSSSSSSSSSPSSSSSRHHLPEYTAHVNQVLTMFIKLLAILVHRWGPGVVDLLQQVGGVGTPNVIVDLILRHYQHMDLAAQKVTLLAMGKLLEAGVKVVCRRVTAIGHKASTPFNRPQDDVEEDELDMALAELRRKRKLMDSSLLEAKKVTYYVSRCCGMLLRNGQPHSEQPTLSLSIPHGSPQSRSAVTSPVARPQSSHGLEAASRAHHHPQHVFRPSRDRKKASSRRLNVTSEKGSRTP